VLLFSFSQFLLFLVEQHTPQDLANHGLWQFIAELDELGHYAIVSVRARFHAKQSPKHLDALDELDQPESDQKGAEDDDQ
jgi:hypothetical protein